ncbi:hypothetical protein E2C01_075581 [Portunus trituberculatus]|uniref:Uncharacterized protein n=1 Tax=Portunus trituberculatus TaxID=210409 RepID=A0A5B7I6G1_PORTR|nr:hypothetical protein [Portunus trituberculatus]
MMITYLAARELLHLAPTIDNIAETKAQNLHQIMRQPSMRIIAILQNSNTPNCNTNKGKRRRRKTQLPDHQPCARTSLRHLCTTEHNDHHSRPQKHQQELS